MRVLDPATTAPARYARARMRRLSPSWLWAHVICATLGANAMAQPVLVVRGPADRAQRWRDALDIRSEPPAAGVTPERLEAVTQIAAALAQARAEAAALHEAAALSTLTGAHALAESHADVPGMARWLAEVELAMALVGAQIRDARPGWSRFTEERLARAVTLDGERALRAGEARPDVVARAEELARAGATGPVADLQLAASARGARAYLDERPLGSLPTTARAPVGRHLIRIEAPGFRPWGSAMDLREGEPAVLDVQLAPSAASTRRARIASATRLAEARALLEGNDELLWVELATATSRAIVTRCRVGGCSAAARRDEPGVALSTPFVLAEDFDSEWDEAQAWLSDVPPPAPLPPRPWQRRWELWLAVATLAGVAAAASITAATPRNDPALRVIIRSEDL